MLRTCADLGSTTNPLKQFLLQQTLWFLALNSTLSPRNFALILLVSPKSSSYVRCPLQCSPSDPIIFDGITPSTRAPFGGEISSHPRRVIASSMTTNGPPHHILIFTPTHASLASVPISQATGSTGHSQTTTSPVPFGYVQGTLCHYRCRLHLGSILCLS